MRSKTTFHAARVGFAFFTSAAITLTGCYGTVSDPPNDPASVPAAAASHPAVVEKQAIKEVEAPPSTDVHETISEADAEKLLGSLDIQPDVFICTACQLRPDLTVVEDDRDQWLWDPGYGWYPGMARGFDVKNIGAGYAGSFHVAVLQGQDSYGFDIPSMNPGTSMYFQITKPSYLGPACGVKAVILVNSFNTLAETNYNNNAITVAGMCLL
jgi:hypothetical protein